MKNILVIEASPRNQASFSHQLGHALVEKLKAKHPGSNVRVRNLATSPFPQLEESHLGAFFTPAESHSEDQKKAVRHSNEAIAEIKNADIIVIASPVYNFSVPSSLKAWIDHICRAGITFSYTESGPKGLVTGKKVYLTIASGAVFSTGPYQSYDFAGPYLRAVLGFLGMTDVTDFRVEGLSMPDLKDSALAKAVESINL